MDVAHAELRFTTSEVQVSEAEGEVHLSVERIGDLSQSLVAFADLSVRGWKDNRPQPSFEDNGVEVTALLGIDVYPFNRATRIEFPSSAVDPEGAARQTLVLPIANTTIDDDADRTFLVRLVTRSGASCLGSNPPAVVTIQDDDDEQPYSLEDATHIALLRHGGGKNARIGGWLRVRTTRGGSLTGTIAFGSGSKVQSFKGEWSPAGTYRASFDDVLPPFIIRGTYTYSSYYLILVARGDSFEAVATHLDRGGYHGESWFYAGSAKRLRPATAEELAALQGKFAFRVQEGDQPQGWGRMVVTSRGKVRMGGTLRGGRRFAFVSKVNAGGEVPIPNGTFLNSQSPIWGRFTFTGENAGSGQLDYKRPVHIGQGSSQRVFFVPTRAAMEAHRVE